MTNNSSQGAFHAQWRFMEMTGQVLKTLSPLTTYFAMINLAPVKDVVSIVGGIVAVICTVLVARSQIKKNNRASRWDQEREYEP